MKTKTVINPITPPLSADRNWEQFEANCVAASSEIVSAKVFSPYTVIFTVRSA